MEDMNENLQNSIPLPLHENILVGQPFLDTPNPNSNILETTNIVPEEKTEVDLSETNDIKQKIAANREEARQVSSTKIQTIIKILKNSREAIDSALRLIEVEEAVAPTVGALDTLAPPTGALNLTDETANQAAKITGKIVEGVFDGEHMVGADGQVYNVPPNYASKSRLIEGDLLKLTITPRGAFVYKQIGPALRERIRGTLVENKETGEFAVTVNDKVYRVLKASITYFKGDEGDEVILLVPKDMPSRWAAVENIVKSAVSHL